MEDHRTGLLERIDQFPSPNVDEPNGQIKISDLTRNLPLLEVRQSMHDRSVRELKQIEKALESMEDGTYGICDECGERIPLARLRTKPHAILCVKCKSNLENR